MSLSLLIFRHAKSDFDAPSDHERTLNELGIQQAKFMGELLNEKAIHPELVVCSSALRAKTTMDLAMQAGEWECDSNITDAIYNTNVDNTLMLIKHFSDMDKVVMLVGHEPTWSELVTQLTGEPVHFGTAGMCCIEFSTDHWSEASPENASFAWYEQP